MKKLRTSLVILLFSSVRLLAQQWQEPLPAGNATTFYQVQANFYQTWGQIEQQVMAARVANAPYQGKHNTPNAPHVAAPSTKGGYKMFKRWADYMEPRVYPSGDLSLPSTNWQRFESYLNSNPVAMQQYQMSRMGNPIGNSPNSMNGPSLPSVLNSTWQFVGPTGAPSGGGAGRINFVRFDPTNTNIIWAGAPAGGLWKSTNGGASWTTNTDQLSVIGCTDLAIDYTNTNTMYLATGDGDAGDTYSIGILKSTDGGATWNATGLTWTVNQGRTISRLQIHPTNPQILLAATSNGIFRTTNGGTSWTQTQTTNSFKDMEFNPADPNTVYATGTRFFKSTDNGVTWTQITSGLPTNTQTNRMAIAVTPANAAYVYVLAGNASNSGFYGLYRSTDNGTTFTQRSSTPNLLGWSSTGADTGGQSWYDLAIAASPTQQDVVIVGGVNIWRSANGGTSWTINGHWTGTGAPYVHADIHDLIFLPGSGTTYFSGNDGGVFKTTNSGGAWSDISNNLCIAQIYRIGLSGSNASLHITGHQDNGTNLRNGASYVETMGGDGMDCFIDRTNNNVMYGEQYNGSLNRSTNGGGSWSGITTGLSGNAAWVTPWYQDPSVANTIYVGYTNLFKSTNQGTNWTQLAALPASPGGTIVDFRVAPSNNQVIYVARSTGLFKTTNGGTSWTTVTGTLPVGSAAITRIAVAPNDPNTVLVTFSGYSSGNKVYRSTNGGTSWTNLSTGLPNLPANCVTMMPGSTNGAYYVGMDVGVYYIDNTFTSWQPYFTGLANVPVFDLEVYQPTGKLRAATYGRGVWEVDIYNPGTLPPVAQFVASASTVCPGNGVNFTDQSSFSPTSWSWTFPSGTPATSTAQNPTGISWSAAGTYTVTLVATNANGSSTYTQTITVLGSQNPPLTEGFENATFLPANWTANNINNDGIFWERSNVGRNSSWSAKFDNYTLDVAGARDEMWAPKMSFAALQTCTLTFDVAYARYDATYSDSLEVVISTNCGATWTSVYLKGGTTLATVPDQTTAFTPTNTQWRNESVNLNAYTGQANVIVAIRNRGRYGNNIYVDNINITGTAAPAGPTAAFTASATTVCAGTAVNFTDNSTGAPTSWSWTFPSGTPASSTTQSPSGIVWNTAGTYTVTLTASNANGNNSTTQVITVNARPTVTATASSTAVCVGSSTTLTGGGANTYNWMPGNLSGASVTVSPTTTTTYTVTGTNTVTGCTNTQTRTITVNNLPTVTATASNTAICVGSSTTLTGGGANTYNWMPGNLSGASVTVSPTTTTTYTVTGTNTVTGCSNTQTRTITVNNLPAVTATASNTTICAGSSTTLTGGGANTYNWMPGNLSGASVTVNPTATTTYTVTGTNTVTGCSNTQTRTITVNNLPTVTATASNTVICVGSSTTLTGGGANTYNWMPGNLSGASVTVSPTTTTTYTVTGTNTVTGCSNTQTRTITVNNLPSVTATASSTSICTGNTVTLSGGGANTYNWMPGNLSGASVSVTPATTTTYTVTGTTTATGCTNTQTLTVTVGSQPTVTASSSNSSLCIGSSTTLTASGTSTYTWMPGNLSGASVTVSPTSTTTYTVTGVNGPGCQNTATVQVTVNTLPAITATSSATSVCAGNTVSLTATGANTYVWMPGNQSGASVTVTPSSTTTYTVTGTNTVTGCSNTQTRTITINALPAVTASSSNSSVCAGGGITLNASGASTYNWMPGNLSGASVTTTPASTTTYTVTGTDANNCSATTTVSVTVNALPTVTASASSAAVCAGSPVTLNASGASTYTWQPGNLSGASVSDAPSAATTYTVTGTDANNCSATTTVSVTVNALPTISSSGNTSICTGGITTITVSGAASYNWMPGNLSGASQSVSPSATTTYTITGTDANGCSSTTLVTVTVGTPPATPSITNVGNVLTSTVTGASYQWYLNGNPIAGATSQTYTATQAGSYTVEVFDPNGCSSGQSNPMVITGIATTVPVADLFQVTPNPNNGEFVITIEAAASEDYVVEVFNALGQVIYSESLTNFSGQYRHEMRVRDFGSGLYSVRLRSNKNENTIRIIVNN
jgi:PKD repeat protein